MFKLLLYSLLLFFTHDAMSQQDTSGKFAIALHGGAGIILRQNMSPEVEEAYKAKLEEALQTGYNVLKHGGTSVDAVVEAIKILEDSPLFNAGKGSVYTHDSKQEMDASIMNGKDRSAGSVAAVHTIKNPIEGARLVMDQSPHVMLVGLGAEQFALRHGAAMVDPSYFHDEYRLKQLEKIRQLDTIRMDHDVPGNPKGINVSEDDEKFGTVGVVALDKSGNLAAGTSTGGMTNKRYGRVGDSPVIGAGTFADNTTCAVSCTGHGEYFIRYVVAYDVHALMAYDDMNLEDAAVSVINKKLLAAGGEGGLVAIDKDGNIAMVFNTPGMYRGYINTEGQMHVAIYRD